MPTSFLGVVVATLVLLRVRLTAANERCPQSNPIIFSSEDPNFIVASLLVKPSSMRMKRAPVARWLESRSVFLDDAMKPTRAPRTANVILGSWLFASAFLWPHASGQIVNMCLTGVLSIVIALIAMVYSRVRYFNALLALWLLISGWTGEVATQVMTWNSTLVAFAMFALSLAPMSPT